MTIATLVRTHPQTSSSQHQNPEIYCLEDGVHHEMYLRMSEDEFQELGDDIYTSKKNLAEEFARQGGNVVICGEDNDIPFVLH